MLKASMAFSSVAEAGGATVLRVPEAPESPMLNRVVGLGVESPATEANVDEALAAIGAGGRSRWPSAKCSFEACCFDSVRR